MEAPTLRCSFCGGDLDPGARTCPSCRSTVEARRCDACFALNLAAAVHCSACGAQLGLEPAPEPDDVVCPACAAPCVALPAGETERVHECTRCSGQYVDHATLRAIFHARVRVPLGDVPRVEPSPHSERVRYLPCPACKQLMNRKNFGDKSGVIVDVCKAHGIWFDPGELPRVLAFVDAGGLEAAERREEARKLDERRAAVHASAVAHLEGTAYDERRDAQRNVDAFLTFLRALLDPRH